MVQMMTDNFHTVYMAGEILGVHCNACGHRAVLDKQILPSIFKGNMERLRDLKLRCRNCGVAGNGVQEFSLYLPINLDDGKAFLSGHEPKGRKAKV